MIRRHLTAIGCAFLLMLTFVGTAAHADAVQFSFQGGPWSYHHHRGWHRYWGGPTIGFYYAPAPAYVVPGYAAPSYYTGPDFWYSNPSFGFNINVGGGGNWHRDLDRNGRYHRGRHDHDHH